MRRYWLPAGSLDEERVIFDGEVFHHIFDVCRQEVGSRFEVLLDNNKAYLVEIRTIEKRRAMGMVLEVRDVPTLPSPFLKLAVSVPRFPVFEAVIEKSVELGVQSVFPFFSEHSFVRNQDKISESKWDRWQKIIVSATQQSGRGQRMELSPARSVIDLLDQFKKAPKAQGLFAFEGTTTLGVKEYLEELLPVSSPEEFWIFVGSEGGFSEREAQMFSEAGLRPITLGSQILRVETACVTLVGILKYHFDLYRTK